MITGSHGHTTDEGEADLFKGRTGVFGSQEESIGVISEINTIQGIGSFVYMLYCASMRACLGFR